MRYDHYELKTAADGKRYITPAKDAKPDVYNPMKEMPGMVLDALNVGMLMMGRRTDEDVETAILEFVTKYGLLGLMTCLLYTSLGERTCPTNGRATTSCFRRW